MTPTNKGNYSFCLNCKYHIPKPFDASSEKYPCYYSHSAVRGDIPTEKQFTTCLLFTPKDIQ